MVTKILKIGEKNQYGNAMTKTITKGSIKKSKKLPSIREFDLLIQGISNEDKIGHLFVVDIKFDTKNASEKQFFFNEIYSLIFEKKKLYGQMKDHFFNFLML